MALWTPIEIPTALWLDASDSSTITIDTGISEWRDKSGNARHPANTVDASQPALISGGLNGLDIARFDGSNDYLLFPSSTATDYPLKFGAQSFALFAVIKPAALSASTNIFFGGRGYDTGWFAGFSVDDPYFRLYNAGERWSPAPMSGITATTDAQIFVSTAPRGAIGSYRKNGLSLQSTSSNVGTQSLANALQVRLGSYVDGSNNTQGPFNGDIAELVLIAGTVTAETIELIEGYLAWKWGLQGSLPTDHPYYDAAPLLPTAVRAVLAQLYDLQAFLVRATREQLYALTARLVAPCDQPYGLRLLVSLIQRFGDVPQFRQVLEQYFGSAAILRRICAQPFDDALALLQTLDQEWVLQDLLRRAMAQRWSIGGEALQAMMLEQYDISEYNLLRGQLDQLWILPPGESLEQRPVIAVTADDVSINPYHITIDTNESDYAIRGEIHLPAEADFLRCRHMQTVLAITVDSTTYLVLADNPRKSRPETGRTEYYVPFSSPAVLLDAPYAAAISRAFEGAMASTIVTEMAATADIAIDWQLVDWYLPSATLYANNETPLAVIRKLVEAVGGILQSAPDGTLICRPLYPVSVNRWDSAAPDFYLTDMDNFFSVDSTPSVRDGYNRFAVSNQDQAAAGLTLEQVDIDNTTKDVLVYQVPWDVNTGVVLETSGGDWVSIVNEGVVERQLPPELVEIVAGEGHTAKPIYGMVSHVYKQADLGEITPAEDGRLTTEIGDNSLVEVVYITRYYKFRCSDALIEDVQFYPSAVPI